MQRLLMEVLMPLKKGSSNKTRGENIKREIASGKPLKQAEAIGYAVQRKSKKESPQEYASHGKLRGK